MRSNANPRASSSVVLFGGTILVSAGLLFCLQPMVGKMLLAPFGGAPAVWNTCMVFFQALLLGGYLYAHLLVTKLDAKKQGVLHIGLVATAWVVLPIAIQAPSWSMRTTQPTATVLLALARSAGLPFFVLSTTAPLLQKWFATASAGHPSRKDPYFLYAASNFGSMIGLLGYPFFAEPLAGLSAQAKGWAISYGLFGVLVVACVVRLLRAPSAEARDEADVKDGEEAARPVTSADRFRWLLYSFVPSSLLLGVTQDVTTDIAAIPMFWVVPLALYLATFMLVFARKPLLKQRWMARVAPLFATFTLICITAEATEPRWLVAFVHLANAFVAWMVCHGELVARRPHASRLTEFYLFMSIGGVLGGIFNALVAPFVFQSIFEYPLAVVAACFCRPRSDKEVEEDTASPAKKRLNLVIPLVLGVAALGIALGARRKLLPLDFHYLVAPLFFVNYYWLHRRVRFAGGLLAILLASAVYPGNLGASIDRERNFFGVVRVTLDRSGTFRQIVHGNTVHGRQSVDPQPERRNEPLTYYHPTGPIGDVFAMLAKREGPRRVASIGLGAGALAYYARAGDDWTFYEINPAVVRMAQDHFTFLRDAKCGVDHERFEIGDARLRLVDARNGAFDVLVLDAFSSDAIPAHLLTREALALYLSKLAPGGVIAMHVSNRYLDLVPPVARLVADARLTGRFREDAASDLVLLARGKTPSAWIAIARDASTLDLDDQRWPALPALAPGVSVGRVWTDDYGNLVSAVRF